MKKIKISKKTGGVMGAAAAVAVAAGIAVGTAGGGMPYKIEKTSDYATALTIEVPEQYDIMELYLGDKLMDKALAPGGKLIAAPIVFTDLGEISVKLYERGEVKATAEFEGKKLKIK